MIRPDSFFCETKQAASRVGLLALMCAISQENWCSAWQQGLEFDLWQIKPGTSYGQETITDNEATLLRLLSEEAGGWWTWGDEDGDTPQFLMTDQWFTRYKKLSAP